MLLVAVGDGGLPSEFVSGADGGGRSSAGIARLLQDDETMPISEEQYVTV